MNKILMLMLMVCSTVGVQAQERAATFSVVPRVGVTVATLTNSDLMLNDNGGKIEAKNTPGFVVGVDGVCHLSDRFAFSLGAAYATLGCKYGNYDVLVEEANDEKLASYEGITNHEITLGYLQVPVMAQYSLAPGFTVKAGVQVGYLCNAKEAYDTRKFQQHIETGARTYDTTATSYENTSTDGYKKMDIAIPLGVSYEYMNVVLDARYHWGLTKVQSPIDAQNRYFSFSVAYRFGL